MYQEKFSLEVHPALGLPGGARSKERRRHKRLKFNPWVGKIPRRRKWQPTLVFLLGKPHGQRSPAVHGVAKSQI